MAFNSGLTSTQNVNIQGGTSNFVTAGTGQTIRHFITTGGDTGQSIGTSGANLGAVTATKTFYLTSISIGSATGGAFELRDGTTIAGAIKTSGWAPLANSTGGWQLTLPVPIPFTTGLFLVMGATIVTIATFSGFEQ